MVKQPELTMDLVRPILTLLLLSGTASSVSAVVRLVPADFPTIQQALDASTAGDIVRVSPGTYVENLTLSAAHDGVKLHSEMGAAVTIIDGNRVQQVIRCQQVGSDTEIVGFTIRNGGRNPLQPTDNGGGILLDQASPSIRNNVITSNFGSLGGGIYAKSSTSIIVDNSIVNNSSARFMGGGLYLEGSPSPRVESNLIQGNSSNGWGGGVLLAVGSTATVVDNEISNNTSQSGGAGLYVSEGGMPTVADNDFHENIVSSGGGGGVWIQAARGVYERNRIERNSGLFGGGLYMHGPTSSQQTIIRENWFADNQARSGSGGGVYFDQMARPLFAFNVVVRSYAAAYGGGVAATAGAQPVMRNNTFVANEAGSGGGGLWAGFEGLPILVANIISHSTSGGVLITDSGFAYFECNDVVLNTPANYSGIANPTGVNKNISEDPLYCDLPSWNLHLSTTSPCAPAQSPSGCGLIGALDPSCSPPVSVQPSTLGRIKALYR